MKIEASWWSIKQVDKGIPSGYLEIFPFTICPTAVRRKWKHKKLAVKFIYCQPHAKAIFSVRFDFTMYTLILSILYNCTGLSHRFINTNCVRTFSSFCLNERKNDESSSCWTKKKKFNIKNHRFREATSFEFSYPHFSKFHFSCFASTKEKWRKLNSLNKKKTHIMKR